MFGNGLTSVGFPVIGATVLGLSAFQLSLLWAAPWLPWLMAVYLGRAATRLPVRAVLVSTNLASSAGMAVLAVSWTTGHLSLALMCGVGVVNGTGTVLFKAMFPLLLRTSFDDNAIMPVNAALFVGAAVAQAVAPLASGYLVSVVSPAVVFCLDGLTFVTSTLVLVAMGRGRVGPGVPEQPVAFEDTSSVRLVTTDVRLRFLLLVSAVSNAGVVGYSAVLVVLLVAGTGAPAADPWVGLAFSGQAVGGVLGAILTQHSAAGARPIRRLAVRMSVFAGPLVGLVVLSGPGPLLWWAFAGNLAAGMLTALLGIVRSNYMSQQVPASMIPRVASTSQLFTNSATLAGALAAGALTEILPVRVVVGIFAGLQVLAGLLILVRFDAHGVPRSARVRRAEARGPFWNRRRAR